MKNPDNHCFLKLRLFALAFLVCALGLSGCLSRPPLKEQTFAFGLPESVATNSAAGGQVLALRKLRIAAPFDNRTLVYRTGDFSYVSDPYAAFLELPEEELIAPLRAGLCRQGDFSTVIGPGSALKADTLLEINVSELYGDFRQMEHPKAVLTMQFLFFDATNGVPLKLLFQKEYSRSIPLEQPNAPALMKGWNQALTEILTDATSDYKQVKAAE
jgi:uncharacterized lipoprotein YmbA